MGRPPETRAPRLRRRPGGSRACASPCQARARVLAIASPRPLPGGTLLPGATAVEALEHELILPGREAGAAVADLDAPVAAGDRHLATGRRVVQRVLDQHVQRPVEIGARAPCRSGALARPASARSRAPRRRRASAPRRVGRHRARRCARPAARGPPRGSARAARRPSRRDGRPRRFRRRARRRPWRPTPAARASSRRSRSAVSGVRS